METQTITRNDLTHFERGYIRTILFAENDQSDASGGDPLDSNYDIEDFSQDALAKIREDCAKFCEANKHMWESLPDRTFPDGVWTAAESAGSDFWYTRAGHGVGFWDPDRKEYYGKDNAEILDVAAHKFGSADVYVADGTIELI